MVDFVAIGHLTIDQTPRGSRPGGAAYYAAITAHRQGLRVGLLTSFGPDFPRDALPSDVSVVNVPSSRTTTFKSRGPFLVAYDVRTAGPYQAAPSLAQRPQASQRSCGPCAR